MREDDWKMRMFGYYFDDWDPHGLRDSPQEAGVHDSGPIEWVTEAAQIDDDDDDDDVGGDEPDCDREDD